MDDFMKFKHHFQLNHLGETYMKTINAIISSICFENSPIQRLISLPLEFSIPQENLNSAMQGGIVE